MHDQVLHRSSSLDRDYVKHLKEIDSYKLLGWHLHSDTQFDKNKEYQGVRMFQLQEKQFLIGVKYEPKQEFTFTFSPFLGKSESALWGKVFFRRANR